ncbi:diacylglycerol/polyprenol kinase family protein [Methanopyrus kandleri]
MTSKELGRQLIHVTFGLLFLLPLHLLGVYGFALLLLSGLIAGVSVSFALKRGLHVPIAKELVDAFERPDEMHIPGQGTLHFVTGLLLATVICPYTKVLDVTIIVLSVGDSVSTIAGKAIGRIPIPYSPRKTVEGSLVGFTAAALASLAWTGDVVISVLAAGVGMLVESLPTPNDNVTIPVTVSVALGFWWGLL